MSIVAVNFQFPPRLQSKNVANRKKKVKVLENANCSCDIMEPFLSYEWTVLETLNVAELQETYDVLVKVTSLINITTNLNRICKNRKCTLPTFFADKFKSKAQELELVALHEADQFILDQTPLDRDLLVDPTLNPLYCEETLDNLLELTW